jgi:hypothetical protein
MHARYPQRDWLETLPEIDAPTADEVQMEFDLLSGSDASMYTAGTQDDWTDCCEA